MILELPRGRRLDLSSPVVMGVLNVTPDSFSDGGRHVGIDAALAAARRMLDDGAAIIDIGGESTRPGADPVSVGEECDRVLPLIERLCSERDCVVSIDTMKPEVMQAACRAGAAIINDVQALQAFGAIEVAAAEQAAVCLMHMQGEPRTMQLAPVYASVVDEVGAFLELRIAACLAQGISAARLLIDPGFGFGKTLAHNLELLAQLPSFQALRLPILVGMSRKGMLGQITGRAVADRTAAGLAAATLAVWNGASIVRTHDVAATVDAVKVAGAVRRAVQAVSAPS
ncbi:dihydropteroate synthase [uncultured Nevskia sp.]|uniref:dihydropteroate synthase n=1 Tax=uncultured Nevskia sp. TaxID=228950 RepID=UPI0025EEA649|nr:dihydropteroate synthase [uncultured Nevskia sp.]